ncbi:MAG: hypothetical protein HZB18_17950 [Chloroflexi bacterium]|nr:hypothetical protein [Chloroflexota bacterium]
MPHADPSTQRILIFGASIFEEGVAYLLTIGTDLHVSYAEYTNEIAFLDDVEQNQPNVILLNESTLLDLARILNLLFSIPSLVGLRVIIIRLIDNRIDVYEMPKQALSRNIYERHQFTVTERDELVALVRG